MRKMSRRGWKDAYEHHRSDRTAAAALGVSRSIFRLWRHERGLPAKDMRGPRLPAKTIAARRKAYEDSPDDQVAAKSLGLDVGTFRGWRNRVGLEGKRAPGQRAHMTKFQEGLLAHLRAHPWSKEHEIWRTFDGNHDRFNLHDALKRLEAKDLTQRGFAAGRAVLWAPAGLDPPKGVTRLAKGAPSLYHAARLPARILELLEREPWLPVRLIAMKLQPAATPKAIEQAVRSLLAQAKIQRRLVDTTPRRFYLYALPGTRLSSKRRAVLEETITNTYGSGLTNVKVFKFLATHKDWYSAREIAEKTGVRSGFIYGVLKRLLQTKHICRVQVRPTVSNFECGHRLVYAVAGTSDPADVMPESGAPRDVMAKILHIVRDRPTISLIELSAEYERRHKHVSLEYLESNINRLVSLGLVQRLMGPGGHHVRGYQTNGGVNEFTAAVAEEHWRAMELERKKLVHLGYRVDMKLHPPEIP